MPESLNPKKPFFKTFFGIITLLILSLLALALVVFVSFFGYYLWAQKYASPELQKELSERYNPSFTKAPGLGGQASQTNKNVAAFIRNHNATFGPEKAPITIVAFIDFECPYSHKSYPIFEEVLKKYGPTVRVVFKNFPIQSIHEHALLASLAGACAQEQNKFWPYYREVFAMSTITEELLKSKATELKLDTTKFSSCIDKQDYNKNVMEDFQDGIALGVEGTPTYFVNQQKVEGVLDSSGWDQVLLKEIQKKK